MVAHAQNRLRAGSDSFVHDLLKEKQLFVVSVVANVPRDEHRVEFGIFLLRGIVVHEAHRTSESIDFLGLRRDLKMNVAKRGKTEDDVVSQFVRSRFNVFKERRGKA